MPPDCPRRCATLAQPLQLPAWAWPLAAALVLTGCNATAPQAAAEPPPPAAVSAAPQPAEPVTPAAAETEAPAPEADDATGTAAPASADPLQQVLAHADRMLRLSPAELAREIARMGEAEDASAQTPLLLANALAQTRQPVDTARALGLVQRVLANGAPAAQPLHPLARLLEARLLQQRRLEDQLERQAQQLRDAQRRNDQLNERLEAVRAIERSLTTRPAPLPAAPAPATSNSPPRTAP